MEMEISCLTVLARGSKIVSVYMVYLQGISHQFEIDVIDAFYNKFLKSEINFLNALGFLPLASQKREALHF